jgi:hypothetical protein
MAQLLLQDKKVVQLCLDAKEKTFYVVYDVLDSEHTIMKGEVNTSEGVIVFRSASDTPADLLRIEPSEDRRQDQGEKLIGKPSKVLIYDGMSANDYGHIPDATAKVLEVKRNGATTMTLENKGPPPGCLLCICFCLACCCELLKAAAGDTSNTSCFPDGASLVVATNTAQKKFKGGCLGQRIWFSMDTADEKVDALVLAVCEMTRGMWEV